MRPIVVLTMGRSGSSLVAGCLALQGMWTGICKPADKYNPKGYFENVKISTATGQHYRGSIYDNLLPIQQIPGWKGYVEQVQRDEDYEGGPWLVKVNAFTWPLWVTFDPIFVFVRRDIQSIVRSASSHDSGVGRWEEIVTAHQVEMNGVKKMFGGFDIWPQKLIDGHYMDIVAPLEMVGLKLDREKVSGFVDKSLWH